MFQIPQAFRITQNNVAIHLLENVPDVSSIVESHHTVISGDVVKRRSFLVAKHDLRNPDSGPWLPFQLQHRIVVVGYRVEAEARIKPLLAKVHA